MSHFPSLPPQGQAQAIRKKRKSRRSQEEIEAHYMERQMAFKSGMPYGAYLQGVDHLLDPMQDGSWRPIYRGYYRDRFVAGFMRKKFPCA